VGVNESLHDVTHNTDIPGTVAGTDATISLQTGPLTVSTTFNVLATSAASGCSVQLAQTATVTVVSNASCNHGHCVNGQCVCDAGFTGAHCDQCAPNYYNY